MPVRVPEPPHVPYALFWLALFGETVLVASEHIESVPGVRFDAETDSGVGTDPTSSRIVTIF